MAGLSLAAIAARAANPNALWEIVHGQCVPHAAAGNPAPCAEVSADWAVLKDLVGATQFLLIPTARVTGIESPDILRPGAPNYFAAAWAARTYTDARAGGPLPRADILLAINAEAARTQDQLHIHVDCIKPAVRDALGHAAIGLAWAPLPVALEGQRYQAIRLDGLDLKADPFRLVADSLPGAAANMARYTIAVAGLPDGFAVLALDGGDQGHSEDLEDHGCTIAARR